MAFHRSHVLSVFKPDSAGDILTVHSKVVRIKVIVDLLHDRFGGERAFITEILHKVVVFIPRKHQFLFKLCHVAPS